MSKSVEERYPFVTENMSVQFKDWAAGTSKHVDHDDFVVSIETSTNTTTYQCTQKTVKYPPALWKIIDEPIVNAIDHFIRCLGTQNPVTKIAIGFDPNGIVSIWNNGIGIEVVKHAAAAQALGLTEIYVPTMIFGHMRQGSNYDNEAQPDCIIGGTNGMGATLGIIRSEWATVETVDARQKPPKYFSQTWKNNREIVLDPIVFDLNVQNCLNHKLTANQICSHTSFTFVPSYTKTFNYKTFGQHEHETFSEVLRMRAWMAAAYVGYTLDNMKPGAKSTKISTAFDMKFNNEDITIRSMDDLAAVMFPTSTRLTTVLWPDKPHPAWRYPWEICIVICDRTGISRQHKKYLSNVNGVLVSSGTHIRYIMDQLSVAVQHRISGKSAQQVEVNAATLSENMFLLLNCKVPNPGWSGQRKDDLTLNAESLKCLEMYKFPKTFLDKFAACIRDQIIDRKLGKTTRRSHIDYDKYIPAKNLANGALIICEGDSAMNRILEVGIAKCLNKDDYGVISTGGVPMNARKAVKEIATKNSVYLQRSDQYNNNKFISALVQACNLNYQYTYSETVLVNGALQPNPNYKKEIASLNYRGGIIFIVDQDLDGMGNIMSLILGKFELFWKGLIHFGYCNTFLTPIIRAYPKSGGRVISFYNNEQYNDWVKLGQIPYTTNVIPQPQPKTRGRGRGKTPVVAVNTPSTNTSVTEVTHPPNLKKYDIYYYKGLGTHSREETISMFRAFLSQLYKFYLDEKSNRMFITCFDKQSSLRKEELMKPLPIYTREQIIAQMELKRISCTDHLLYVFGEYARDNLARKLNHVIDGQNQAGRKILDGIIKAFASHNKKTKADTLAGYIKEKENYHHGVVSLETSVQIRAFIATGGAQLPFLIPHSNLGSRKAGGDDRAAARYTDVTLNKKLVPLLFSKLDYPLLDFHFDEGNRGEPKFFVPILPLVVLESINVPSTGWRIKTWARCVFETIDRVRYMIQYTDKFIGGELSPSIYKGAPYEWKGEFRVYGTEMYSFGVYVYDSQSNTITITELPLRVWTSDYLKCIGKRINCTHGGAGDDSKNGDDFKPKYKAKPKKLNKQTKPNKPAKPELFDNTNNLVDGYESRGDDLNILIIIKLKPGAITTLEEYGTSFMDGIESYFMLGDHMDQGINLMGMNMNAIEFTNYNDPINEWFLVRKEFYKLRLERIRLLNVLAQKREENIIRYIEIYQTLKIPNKTEDEQNAILGEHKFDRINSVLLDNPKFTANNDLESAILGSSLSISSEITEVTLDNNDVVTDDTDTLVETPIEDKTASYNYLLNITDRGKSTQSLAKHKAKLVDLNRELEEHDTLAAQGRFMGAQVWLNELNEVESVIKAGMSTFWMFERANKFQFDD